MIKINLQGLKVLFLYLIILINRFSVYFIVKLITKITYIASELWSNWIKKENVFILNFEPLVF